MRPADAATGKRSKAAGLHLKRYEHPLRCTGQLCSRPHPTAIAVHCGVTLAGASATGLFASKRETRTSAQGGSDQKGCPGISLHPLHRLRLQGPGKACTLGNLRAGCTYRARVRAFNQQGPGPTSMPADVATAPAVPEAPASLAPTTRNQTGITPFATGGEIYPLAQT